MRTAEGCDQTALSFLSSPQLPIQRSILNRLVEVILANHLAPSQVRERPRDLEDPVVGSRTEVELVHGLLQQSIAMRIQLAVFSHELGWHVGIAEDAGESSEALRLDLARGDDS